MQSVSIGYGKATFKTASITLAGFVVEPPFIRTLASKKLTKHGSTIRIPVSNTPDIDGWLFQDTVQAPDGIILMVQMQHKYRGSGLRDGAIFIRAREEGAGMLITANIPSDPRSTLGTSQHTVFAGSGDILTLEELNSAGIELNKNFISAFMDPEELAECYNITVTHTATSAPPVEEVHTTPTGGEVTLRIAKTPRRMRVRRT